MKEYRTDCPLKEIMYCPYCQMCLEEAQEEIDNEILDKDEKEKETEE